MCILDVYKRQPLRDFSISRKIRDTALYVKSGKAYFKQSGTASKIGVFAVEVLFLLLGGKL